MLCDSPTAYEKEPETLDYIVRFPTRFDQTLIPAGEIGRYIVTARRAGDRWYLGALTNWDAREVEVKLDFLGDGRWKARIFRDGVNADRYGEDYLLEERTVTAADSLAMAMAPGRRLRRAVRTGAVISDRTNTRSAFGCSSFVCRYGIQKGGPAPRNRTPPPLHSYGRVRHSSSQLPSSA